MPFGRTSGSSGLAPVVFDVAQRVQQRGLFIVRHVIERAVRCGVDLRIVAHHFDFQVFISAMGGLLLLSRVRFCAIDTFCRRQRGDLHIAIFQTGSAIGLAEGECV